MRAVESVDEVERLQAEQDRAAAADRRGESEFADDDAAVGMDSLADEAGPEAGGEPGRISQLDTPDPRWNIEQAQAGNDFNRSQRGVYSAEELLLENGKRVDGYTPGLVIVSRKRTQFSEISPMTAEKYVIELLDKYGPGNIVADKPYNRVHYPRLVGQPLDGQLVLEVSVQHTPIPEELGSLARRWGVVIRDFNGTILN